MLRDLGNIRKNNIFHGIVVGILHLMFSRIEFYLLLLLLLLSNMLPDHCTLKLYCAIRGFVSRAAVFLFTVRRCLLC